MAIPAVVRAALGDRSGGWCEAGLSGCARHAVDPHHRKSTKAGGRRGGAKKRHDSLSNLLHLCRPCHQYVTSTYGERRTYATDTGLIVLEHEDPWEVLVTTPALVRLHGGPVQLGDCGSVWPANLSELAVEEK